MSVVAPLIASHESPWNLFLLFNDLGLSPSPSNPGLVRRVIAVHTRVLAAMFERGLTLSASILVVFATCAMARPAGGWWAFLELSHRLPEEV